VKPDWERIKTQFINGGGTYASLAKEHDVKETAIRARASRNKWIEERNQASLIVTEKAANEMMNERATQLARWNDEDIQLARAIRSRAATLMVGKGDTLSETELRTIASVVDTAQKIARLAFGAATENSIVSNRELPSSIHEFV
jgi:hypothetical protein